MKKIVLTILFYCFTIHIHAQCESSAKKLWNSIQAENYTALEDFIMSSEQQRKLMHWPKSEEADKILSKYAPEFKKLLVKSAKKLRTEIINQGFNIEKTVYKHCEFKEKNVLTITLSDSEKEFTFFVETETLDAIYLVYPINETLPKLPKVQFTEEELANMTTIIDGKEYKNIEITEAQRKKGQKIVEEKCLKGKKSPFQKILFKDGMKSQSGNVILTFIVVGENPQSAFVNLSLEKCEDWK